MRVGDEFVRNICKIVGHAKPTRNKRLISSYDNPAKMQIEFTGKDICSRCLDFSTAKVYVKYGELRNRKFATLNRAKDRINCLLDNGKGT